MLDANFDIRPSQWRRAPHQYLATALHRWVPCVSSHRRCHYRVSVLLRTVFEVMLNGWTRQQSSTVAEV